MIQVKTFIVNPDTGGSININNFSSSSKMELVYGFIEIHADHSKVFDGAIEALPSYWLIVLQIIEGVFRDWVGEWEFPTLLKFEAVDADTIQVRQNEKIYHVPNKAFIKALLDACTVFINASEKFMEYPVEIELVKGKYFTQIEQLHQKNNAL